jgi:NAD(P)H-nitrite reductase large subunit
MVKAEKVKYLIIGNSAGSIGAVEAIREVDKVGTMAIVAAESYPAYSRPLISEYLAEPCPLEKMLFRPTDFYQKNNIQTILGKLVKRLDIDSCTVELDDGQKIFWEKLLLATGGSPIIPEIEGTKREGVFTFTTLDDAKAIDQFLNEYPKRTVQAVVIGGGLIGMSVTEALVKRGVEVTIVEMKERILNTILDEETSAMETEALKDVGVEIITGRTITKVSSYVGGATTGVTLDNSRPIPCEMVIIAIGVRPRTELVSGTGIKINRGIVVDKKMNTSCPDVYACGDVAEAYDFVYGENRLTPVWPNACVGGRVAGFNMAGVPTEYQGGTSMNSLRYFGLAIVSAGLVTVPDDSYEVLSARHERNYKKVILRDGFVVGMVFAGDIEKSGIVFNLMKDRVEVDGFKKALIADDFGLSFLPEEIWRKRLERPGSQVVSQERSGAIPEKAIVRQ